MGSVQKDEVDLYTLTKRSLKTYYWWKKKKNTLQDSTYDATYIKSKNVCIVPKYTVKSVERD